MLPADVPHRSVAAPPGEDDLQFLLRRSLFPLLCQPDLLGGRAAILGALPDASSGLRPSSASGSFSRGGCQHGGGVQASSLRDHPSLDASVRNFLDSRLEAEINSWEGGHVVNNATPVALVEALQSTGRPTRDAAIAAKAYLLDNLTAIYDWDQLQRLRRIEPSLFPNKGDATLRTRFGELATEMAASGYEELEDVDDLLQIESMARELEVDLVQQDFDRAHQEVERYARSREEQVKSADDEKRLASTYGSGEDEAGQVDAVFARLASPEAD